MCKLSASANKNWLVANLLFPFFQRGLFASQRKNGCRARSQAQEDAELEAIDLDRGSSSSRSQKDGQLLNQTSAGEMSAE